MKKYVFESLKFFCAAILCVILSAFATPSWGANCNLIDESQILNSNGFSINENGYYNGSFYDWDRVSFSFDNAFKENTQYTLSFNGYVSSNAAVFSFSYTDGTVGRCGITATQATDYTCTTEPNKTLSNITTTYGSGVNTVYVKNIQLEEGTTATAYTPYNPLCATCNGTIVNYVSATGTVSQSGTPTPDNPIEPTFYKQGDMVLRKVGDIADSYDATTGKITRRVGVAVLDGTERWGSHTSNTGWFQLAGDIFPTDVNASALSTHYMQYTHNPSGMANQDILFGRPDSNTGRVVIRDAINFPDVGLVGDFKSWLAQQYAAGTPVTVWYPLKTETTEDWPASYCETPIKIATTKYNETKFSPLNTALANAISVVDTVVSNTITQAGRIATLQAQKQTRPDPSAEDGTCPAYKQCLLVEDENGTPHWYEITDPFRDFVAPIIANNVAPASTTNSAGYTQLEYIESTGTQYIDTGAYITSNNLLVKTKVYSTSTSATEQDVFGNQDGITGRTVFGITGANVANVGNNWFLYSRYSTEVATPNAYTPAAQNQIFNMDVHVENGQKWFVVDGVATETQTATDITNSNNTVQLFADGKTTMNNIFKGRMYYFQMWNNGTLVRNFVPVRNNATGKCGLYDTVGKQFYGNANTSGDDFTPGPEVLNQDPDVPGMTWTATWAANATTGVTAGTITGEGVCNGVTGTESTAATSTQTSSANWSVDGANCWCKTTAIDDGDDTTIVDGVWVFYYARSSAADCALNCAYACAARVRDNASFRSALFGM